VERELRSSLSTLLSGTRPSVPTSLEYHRRRRFGMRALLCVLVVAVAGTAASAGWAGPHYILHGTVGPGGALALTDGVGNPYTSGKSGMYILIVTDRSPRAGFHLVGPGVDVKVTGVGFVGSRTVGVTLGPGTYAYRSDSHPARPGRTFVLTP
jgi:hypothetical protein